MKIKDSRILVTGADGFIGSHLVEQLVTMGAQVRALSYYNSFNHWGWLEDIDQRNVEIISGDVRDYNYCLKITEDIDIVFHLAALIAIPFSYVAPASYIDTNITGTSNICLSALKNKVKKVVHTSTSEVYGTAEYVPIDEKHPLKAQSPYSASKIAADAMAMSFYNSFDLPLATARPFNTYGPRQSARAVIPTLITQLMSGQKQIHIGDITPTRDFNYVLDTCNGFIKIAENENSIGEVINIGSNTEISVGDVFHLLKKEIGSTAELTTDKNRIRPQKSEVTRLVCDNSKAKRLVDFTPQYSLERGLKETIKWFSDQSNLKKYKTNIYNV